jgi:hypothetical protein
LDTAVLVASALIGLTPIVAGALFLARAAGGLRQRKEERR